MIRPLIALPLALLLASPLLAQTHRASLRGLVLDAARAPVPEAELTLVHEATSETRRTVADPDGRFALSQLPPGAHRLEVALAGYKRHVHVLALQVNQELWVDVGLELGSLSEEVVVTAPYVPVERVSAALGTVIDARQVSGLPLDGRNFLDLSLLVPGAAPAAPGSAGSVRGEFAFNVNGAREDANSFLLDGVYNLDPKLNSVAVRPPVDAIREFEVLTSTYDASFGRNAGAQVNVITRSGSNRLDGSAWGFLRTPALGARNHFAPPDDASPEYSRRQAGASLGGPVARNRTFFFADYERMRLREGITQVTNVPTEAERRGDFTDSPFRPPLNPFTGQPFPGNRIPEGFLHPVGAALAALYPLPNRAVPFRNYVSSPSLRDQTDHVDVRVDHVLADGSTLTARYSFGDRDLYEPFSGAGFAAVPGFGTHVPRRAQNLALAHTWLLSPALVNEARVAYTRVSAGSFHENMGTSLNRTVGLPELSSNPRAFGLSFITVSGYSPLGDEFTNPQASTTDMLQVLDTATWARGRHLLKFGFDVRALQQRAFRDVQSRGFLTFTDQAPYTGHALADLLLGLPFVTGGARLDNRQHLRTESYSLFVNDNLALTPSLTLSAGLRYEYTSPPVDPQDRATVYDPATQSLVQVGTGGVPRSGYQADRNNVAPRLGLAWTADAAGETVVRGGYGVYYDQPSLAPGEGLYFSAPYFDFNLYFPLPGLPLTLSDPFPSFFPVAWPQSALAFQRDLRTGYLQHWNVNLQRQLGRTRAVEIAYVGSSGHSLIAARDINQPPPSPAPFNPRPVPQFDDITLIESRASSRYNALQLRFQQRLERGLSLLAGYTLGRSTDDASSFFWSAGDPNFPQDSRTPGRERGRSNFDVRHRLSVSFAYELPFGSGRARLAHRGWITTLVSGWDVQGIVSVQAGRPFTVALLPEWDNSNTGRSVLGFGANDRPNLIGDPALGSSGPERWFDTAAFAPPPFGSFGDAGRNILDGPGYRNVNLALLRHVPLGEARALQIRFEAFNVFNTTNFDLPDNFLGSPTFGQILSAQSPRRVQFGARVLF